MFYVHTLAFNRLDVVEAAVENYISTRGDRGHQYLVVDCNYPLGDSDHRAQTLKSLAEKAQGYYLKLPETVHGVAQSWSYVWKTVGGGKDDILFGFDPDVRMQNKDWVWAVNEAFEHMPDAGVVIMNRRGFAEYTRFQNIHKAGSVFVLEYNALVAWPCGAYHGRFMDKVQGEVKQDNAHYGFIEHWSARMLSKFGLKWYQLRDYFDDHQSTPDPLYAAWKREAASRVTTSSFKDWLTEKGHI